MFYKDRKTKVGLIATVSPEETNSEGFVARANKTREGMFKAKDALRKIDVNVYDCGEIARTYKEMSEQGEILRRQEIHVLVIYIGSWAYSANSIAAALKAGVPVIVWADSSIKSGGALVGGAIARGALDEAGIKNYLVYGDFEDTRVLNKLKTLCLGIGGATKLRGMIYGEGGTRCMGMVTTRIDPSEWITKFGIDVDGFEQVDVIRRAERYSDEDAQKFLNWMKEEFGGIEPKKEVMIAQIKLYFALRELIMEKGYDFISVKCLPEMPSCYTSFCLAHALLNDTLDDGFGERGSFVMSCEADSNAALTMQILNNIAGDTTLFADVLHYDYDENTIRLCNCGSEPTNFARSRKDVTWVCEDIKEFHWIIGGAYPRFVGKSGEVTLARLARVNRQYVMQIIKGKALDLPPEKMNETSSKRPHIFVRLDCNQEDFINTLRSNHMHLVYGNYIQELLKTCEVLDIKPILI